MNYILFDDATRDNLLPLTFMRPVADIRIGILTIREKWEMYLNSKTSTLTEDYLKIKYPIIKNSNSMLINASVCPNVELVKEIKSLKPNQAVVKNETIVAWYIQTDDLEKIEDGCAEGFKNTETDIDFLEISDIWDVFAKNGEAIDHDYKLLTKNRESQPLSETNSFYSKENIFIEEGAKVEFAILNATNGPIYIGKNAEVMEGSIIRGPFALCENSIVKMAAKIYGPTTIGPYSKVGGELNNCVFIGYSNKAHDGFLGNSVIGEWCNLGADTNNSNLKNTYDNVRLWNYPEQTFVNTGLQFCGLIMGDHSKCGINTMFNSGTVVGVNSNIFGPGFQRNFIPSFSWGGVSKMSSYSLTKAIEVAIAVYKRRGMEFDETEQEILTSVYNLTHKNRRL